MISTSTCLMVTGAAPAPALGMASTKAASQGAGHNRPVNSGKLFVACRSSSAPAKSPVRTRSFQSGMRLPRGQAWWQNGIPQSIQRPACALIRSSSACVYTSRQFIRRIGTGRLAGSWRSVVRNPVGSGMRLGLVGGRAVGRASLATLAGQARSRRGQTGPTRLDRSVSAVADVRVRAFGVKWYGKALCYGEVLWNRKARRYGGQGAAVAVNAAIAVGAALLDDGLVVAGYDGGEPLQAVRPGGEQPFGDG